VSEFGSSDDCCSVLDTVLMDTAVQAVIVRSETVLRFLDAGPLASHLCYDLLVRIQTVHQFGSEPPENY
jgi:hypothetical protein